MISQQNKVKTLELGETTPLTNDKIIDISPIQSDTKLSASERAKQLREYRAQLLHQEKEEEPCQLKIGSQK